MRHLTSMFRARGKRIGLVSVREHGLDLEVWEGGPRPCWSIGVLHAETNDHEPAAMVDIPDVRRWLLVLPTYMCTTRYVELPSDRPEEIAAMLEFEVPQLVPCGTQAWTWDFCVTDQRPDGAAQVLVVLSPLSAVEAAVEQVNTLGIKPFLVTVSALLNTVRLAHRTDTSGATLCGYVWWDHRSLDFSAMDGSRLVFLRGVRVYGQNSQTPGSVETELDRSLSMLRERGICDGELPIQIGGTHSELPLVVERLRQRALVHADPARDRAMHDGAFSSRGISDAAISGGHFPLACVNLLPGDRKQKDRRARRRREIVGIGLRICLLVLLTLLCLKMCVWREARVLQQYQQRLGQIAPLAQKLQFLQRQLNMIQAQVQGSVSTLDVIGQLYEVLPEDVTIHHLAVDQDRQVVIRAQAKRLSQAFDCIDLLERSEYLANVRQNYAHQRELEGRILIDFELWTELEDGPVEADQ